MKLNELDDYCGADPIVNSAIKDIKDHREKIKKLLKSANMEVTKEGAIKGNFKIEQPKEVKSDNLKKLHLSESLFLNESFSPSMPDWLKKRLMYDASKNNTNRRDAYKSRGNDFSGLTGNWGMNILRCLNNAGVDLANAEFISTRPTSGKDKILKYPNICIFHLVHEGKGTWDDESFDQIYIRRLDDENKANGLNGDDTVRIGYDDKHYRHLSVKQLLDYTKDFCYIDGSNKNNFVVDKRNDRNQEKQEIDKLFNYNRLDFNMLDSDAIAKINAGRSKYDKSGYIRDPKKYVKKLESNKRNNSAAILQSIYDRLSKVKDALVDALSKYDINKTSGLDYDNYRTFVTSSSRYSSDNIFDKFDDAIYAYNDVVKNVDYALSLPESDSERTVILDRVFGTDSEFGMMRDLEKKVSAAERLVYGSFKEPLTKDFI